MTAARIEWIGDAVLYLADCHTIMPALPAVGAVVTDPPYGTGLAPKGGKAAGSIDPAGYKGGGVRPEWDVYSEEWMAHLQGVPMAVFCGQSTVNLGRKFVGIEMDPAYFDIACERIRAAYAQQRLFA